MRFIQVGVGGFGQRWVSCLKESRDAQVVAMVDVNEKSLEAARESAGYDKSVCFKSLKDALKAVKADAVVCVTPPKHHRKVVVAAMKAGMDVISEKPMAASFIDCKAMLRAAEQTGRSYVVSQNYRYQPETWTMADLVRRGTIGEIGQVNVDFIMGVDFGGGFRHAMEYPLLVDMSIHHFDLIRFITGLDAVSVTGVAWNPPWSNYKGKCSSSIVFEMNNGAHVVYTASWCAKGQFTNWNGDWHVEGSKGTLVYRNNVITHYDVPEVYKVKKTREVKMKSPGKMSQEFVLNDFVKSVKAGKRPRTDVYDNVRSIGMVFAAVQAVKTGKRVRVLDAETERMIRNK
ncbi:MAG: Gfo/Idh/MocA family oxidoreductase [Lentisphaerae bacterium]|nr:Gfo/Idh/MocA family oxidoreductase [Lentisphaerota bacterium]